ncbi:MAG: hypothetical protein KF889_04825 [Alphaproteobacteria bacterium]|nr:hypothetical protein [Alphaproteobacteria bacterium]MCW5742192.1 hypothetical protein [Alphaproteobacteria bacterium]
MNEPQLRPSLRYRVRMFVWTWTRENMRWSVLRNIGNSSLAKSAFLVPVLGYFILYNTEVVNWLNEHSMLGSGTGRAGWRIHFLYFGGCAFALGSILYAWRCPATVKKYKDSTEYRAGEESVMAAHPEKELKDLIPIGGPREHQIMMRRLASNFVSAYSNRSEYGSGGKTAQMAVESREELLRVLYAFDTLDTSNRRIRLLVFVCYTVGTILIATPTVFTVGQVAWQIIEGHPSETRSGRSQTKIPPRALGYRL